MEDGIFQWVFVFILNMSSICDIMFLPGDIVE